MAKAMLFGRSVVRVAAVGGHRLNRANGMASAIAW